MEFILFESGKIDRTDMTIFNEHVFGDDKVGGAEGEEIDQSAKLNLVQT